MSAEAGPVHPVLRIVRGTPTPEELAAVVAVLLTRSGGASDPTPVAPSLWSQPHLRRPLHPGPGAWRASALPS